jgi:hypothetical protein
MILLTWLACAIALGLGLLPCLGAAADRVVLVEHYTNYR